MLIKLLKWTVYFLSKCICSVRVLNVEYKTAILVSTYSAYDSIIAYRFDQNISYGFKREITLIMSISVIDDLETIEKLLNTLSADDIVRESFIQEVIDYINSSTISVIGIPVFDCPKCQGGQDDPSSPLKGIIPLDVNQVFFGLATQQLAKIESR